MYLTWAKFFERLDNVGINVVLSEHIENIDGKKSDFASGNPFFWEYLGVFQSIFPNF